MKRIAVVGGGIGGLAAALLLAHKGFRVDLFERQEAPGGKALSLETKGFRFDTGPTLFTMPFVLEDIFTSTGRNLGDYMELLPLDEITRYFYPDGTRFRAYKEMAAYYREVKRAFTDSPQQVSRYLSYCRTLYDLTADIFLFTPFQEWRELLTDRYRWTKLPEQWKMDPFRSMHRANKSFFSDKRLIQMMDRFATFNGSSPYKVPATLNIVAHVEHMGAYVPARGIHAIPEALVRAGREEGITYHFGSPVERITVTGRQVSGIRCGGRDYDFDIVVSNSDVHNTYLNLLERPNLFPAVKYRLLSPSTSALVFYWGMRGREDTLATHNILFSKNYRREFRDLLRRKVCPRDPTVYIYISSRFNGKDAPKGCENWYVMINAPYLSVNQDWNGEVERSRETIKKKILDILDIDVDSRLVTEEILTPEDIEERTLSRDGSIYGISSNNTIAAFLRQRNRSKQFKGLYFCGGSATPGGGIPLALLSGKITADLIQGFES